MSEDKGVMARKAKALLPEIHRLAQKGVTDSAIAEKLGLKTYVVYTKTTKYWRDKMKNKNKEK